MQKQLELGEIGFITIALDRLSFEENRNPKRGFSLEEKRDLERVKNEWDLLYRAVHMMKNKTNVNFSFPEEK